MILGVTKEQAIDMLLEMLTAENKRAGCVVVNPFLEGAYEYGYMAGVAAEINRKPNPPVMIYFGNCECSCHQEKDRCEECCNGAMVRKG